MSGASSGSGVPRLHRMLLTVVLLVVVAVGSGCSTPRWDAPAAFLPSDVPTGDAPAGDTPPGDTPPSDSLTTPPSAGGAPSVRERLRQIVRDGAGRPGFASTLATLPAGAPTGHSRAAVTSLAAAVLDLAEASMRPRPRGTDPEDALRRVLRGQSPMSQSLVRRGGEVLDAKDWEALLTATFDRPVVGPSYLFSRWEVRTDRLSFDDGSTAPVLEVELQTAARFTIGTAATRRPIVLKRSVMLAAHRDSTDADPVAAFSSGYSPLFSDWCVLRNGGVLRPGGDTASLRRDLRAYGDLVARGESGRSLFAAQGDNASALARCRTPG